MRKIKGNDNLELFAEHYSTRYSWGHKAKAYYNNKLIAETKIRYYNRTWERYQFETILYSLLEKIKKNKKNNIPESDINEVYKLIKE